jgi:hypothetical protein
MQIQFRTRPVTLAVAAVGMFLGVTRACLGQVSSPPKATKPKSAANSRLAESADSISSGPLDATISGNVYSNRFFGFSLAYPQGWLVISAPAASSSPSQNQAVRPSQPPGNRATQSTEQGVFSLFLAVEGNSSDPLYRRRRLGITATRLKDPNVSIRDHLEAGRHMFTAKNPRIQMVGDPAPIVLGERHFWKQALIQEESGTLYHLETFLTKSHGYVLQFVLWARDAVGASQLDPILQSLKVARNSDMN